MGVTALVVLAGLATPVLPRPAEVAPVADGAPEPFLADEPYTGSVADPTVLRLPDGRFLASMTTTANLNLPLMLSHDLDTWKPRKPLRNWWQWSSWKRYNEAMLHKPRWAATRHMRGKVALMSQWAPDLERVHGRYLAAYSAAIRLASPGVLRRSCIGIASSAYPLGQYRDRRRKPLVCFGPAPRGAIDPDLFVGPRGTPWLLWKNEGVPQTSPPQIMVRRLNARGTGFAPGTRSRVLISRDPGWEGGVIENPSMIRAGGQFFLFYSGNKWQTDRYATGWAVCERPSGGCSKPPDNKLTFPDEDIAGTGGASAFFKDGGNQNLRLAYHAFDADAVGAGNTRRLHIATARVVGEGQDARIEITEAG